MRLNPHFRALAAMSALGMTSAALSAPTRTKEEIEAEAEQANSIKKAMMEAAIKEQRSIDAQAYTWKPRNPARYKPGPFRAPDSEGQPADRAARRRAQRAEAKLQAQLWKRRGR